MRGCTRDNMITIVSFGECNRGSRISKPIDTNAESLHRSSIGRAVADVISCGYSSSSHPPGNREIVTSYHSASTLKTPSSTGLPSTSMGPQHSVTQFTNEGRSSSMPASHPLCQQIRGAKAQSLIRTCHQFHQTQSNLLIF
jgi:hypothetical protein